MEVGNAGSVKGTEKWNAMIVMEVVIAIIVMDMARTHAVNVMVKAVRDVTSVEVLVHAGNVAVLDALHVNTAQVKDKFYIQIKLMVQDGLNAINVKAQELLNAQIALGYLAEAAESVKSAKDQVNWSVANVTALAK